MSRQQLLDALLDQPAYRSLYQENPTFHASLDLMVNMLPLWISGLASQGLKEERHVIEKLQQIYTDTIPNIPNTSTTSLTLSGGNPTQHFTIPSIPTQPSKPLPKAPVRKRAPATRKAAPRKTVKKTALSPPKRGRR